uniref:Zasp-like motif domain-containing protein n=1 Tax=Syphacia muris TaxID=451379 RepID=A0A158R658_9BILA
MRIQPNPGELLCATTGTTTEPNSGNYVQQNIYGTTRQIVTTREVSSGEQFFPSQSPLSLNVMESESNEPSGPQHQPPVMSHNNLQQKQVQLQHHYQPQQQVQTRSLPPIQSQQVIIRYRLEISV